MLSADVRTVSGADAGRCTRSCCSRKVCSGPVGDGVILLKFNINKLYHPHKQKVFNGL